MMKNPTRPKLKALRKKSQLNQTEFWKTVGVSQAAGSRYENGLKTIPPSVRIILKMKHGYRGG